MPQFVCVGLRYNVTLMAFSLFPRISRTFLVKYFFSSLVVCWCWCRAVFGCPKNVSLSLFLLRRCRPAGWSGEEKSGGAGARVSWLAWSCCKVRVRASAAGRQLVLERKKAGPLFLSLSRFSFVFFLCGAGAVCLLLGFPIWPTKHSKHEYCG